VDDSLDAIAGGLQALLGGGSSDEDDEEGEGEGGKKPPAFVVETYKRKRPSGGGDGGGPAELELSLASSHHSLWGASIANRCMRQPMLSAEC
jgi:hypothetical protein